MFTWEEAIGLEYVPLKRGVTVDLLKELGFTDYIGGRWYKCIVLDDRGDISLDITIREENNRLFPVAQVMVIDNNYGQHFPLYWLNNDFALEMCKRLEALDLSEIIDFEAELPGEDTVNMAKG